MRDLLDLFLTFFKLGLFTFGGGYAMIPSIREEIIERKKWIDENTLLNIIAVAESTPGPIAINLATYIGFKRKKALGSIFSTIGVALPSLIIIFIISLFFNKLMNNIYIQYAFIGIKCAIGILILKAGIQMLIKMKKGLFNILLFIIGIITVIIFEIFGGISSIYLILIGGLIGIIISSFKKMDGDNI